MCFLLKSPERFVCEARYYRPICLLPSLGKLLKRLIVTELFQWRSERVLFSEHQFGFRRGKSTQDAVLEVVGFVR